MPREISSICLNRHFPNLCLLFHDSFSPAFLQGRFLWMFTGEMAVATLHCCSCAPGCCSCSMVSWQISVCNTQDRSKSCRAAALGQAWRSFTRILTWYCCSCCVLTGLKVLGRQCSMLYKKLLMLKALSTPSLIYTMQKW